MSETVEITGHLIDTGILSRVLDDIREYGGDWVIDRFDVGHEAADLSSARDHDLRRGRRGAAAAADAAADPRRQPGRPRRGRDRRRASRTASSPTASTPPPTSRPGCASTAAGCAVENPEMDCGLIVDGAGDAAAGLHAADGRREGRHEGRLRRLRHPGRRAGDDQGRGLLRLHGVRRLQREAAGGAGPPGRRRHARGQGRRQEGAVGRRPRRRAHRRRAGHGRAGRTPASSTCCSPATRWPPTTSSPSLFGTSLGVDLAQGRGVEHGHEHHIRALNTIRKAGSIQTAVDSGRADRRDHARAGHPAARSTSWSARCATTARCPTSTPT